MDEETLRITYHLNEWWTTNKVNKAMLFDTKRDMFNKLVQVIDDDTVLSLVGARWTGKTTLMYQLIDYLLEKGIESKKILYVRMDNPYILKTGIEGILDGYCEKILKKQIRAIDKAYLFIDEIQYCEGWQQLLKQYHDLRYSLKFIISGSSSVKIKKGQSPLLGRIYQKELFSMGFREYLRFCKREDILDKIKGELIDTLSKPNELENFYEAVRVYKSEISILLDEYLLKGGYPDALKNPDLQVWQNVLQNVIKRTVYEDITVAYNVRKPRRIEDLLAFIALNTSQIFSYTSISKQIDERVETVMNYIEYLKSAYLIEELPVYAKSARYIRQPKKFFLLDIGLRNAFFKENEDTLSERARVGHIVETAIQGNLVSCYRDIYNVCYWKNAREVDIVLDLKTKSIPIEVKYKNKILKEDTKGLTEFMNKFSVDAGVIVTKDMFKYENQDNKKIFFIPAYLFLLLLK